MFQNNDTKILYKIVNYMYANDAWDPIWKPYLCYNSVDKFVSSLQIIMKKTSYRPEYIPVDYIEYFSCPRQYAMWNCREKEIIGDIFHIYMP